MVELIKEARFESKLLEFTDNIVTSSNVANLAITNFGAVKNLTLIIKPKTIIIGNNNTGKSTIAKLLTVLLDMTFYTNDPDVDDFISALDLFEINYISDKTSIFIASNLGMLIFTNGKIASYSKDIFNDHNLAEDVKEKIKTYRNLKNAFPINTKNKLALFKLFMELDNKNKNETNIKALEAMLKVEDIFDILKAIYIPAERGLISLLSQSLYSIISNKIAIPDFIKDFGSRFESARNQVGKVKILAIKSIEYRNESGQDRVYYDGENSILLSEAASGIRCLVPLYLVMMAQADKPRATFIIEEPEINLHPSSQKNLVRFIAEVTASKGKSFITTTHSPYILSAFNNLIQAGTLAQERPELADEINKIIPKESWINCEDVSAYVLENGTARSILDEEWKGIVADEIDKASQVIGDEYERLLELKYKDEA